MMIRISPHRNNVLSEVRSILKQMDPALPIGIGAEFHFNRDNIMGTAHDDVYLFASIRMRIIARASNIACAQ
jgi:hypothetical protein